MAVNEGWWIKVETIRDIPFITSFLIISSHLLLFLQQTYKVLCKEAKISSFFLLRAHRPASSSSYFSCITWYDISDGNRHEDDQEVEEEGHPKKYKWKREKKEDQNRRNPQLNILLFFLDIIMMIILIFYSWFCIPLISLDLSLSLFLLDLFASAWTLNFQEHEKKISWTSLGSNEEDENVQLNVCSCLPSPFLCKLSFSLISLFSRFSFFTSFRSEIEFETCFLSLSFSLFKKEHHHQGSCLFFVFLFVSQTNKRYEKRDEKNHE